LLVAAAFVAMPAALSSVTVIAVVVTYHPDAQALALQLAALLPQVARVVVVDNGSAAVELSMVRTSAGVDLIELGHNRGVAAAQNRGIEHARATGASHVLLMDQDSVPASDMVSRLLAALDTPAPRALAAAGPRLFDPRSRASLDYLKKQGGRFRQFPTPETADAPLGVDHLISSGCLIPVGVLETIGSMDEGLFIDAVDTEWCMRACAAGFGLVLETRAVLTHHLGENSLRLRTGARRVRTLALHSPARQYYIFRNNLLLCRRPYVDRAWRWLMARVLPRRFVFYLVFGPERLVFLQAMLAGMGDAYRGRSGERPCADTGTTR
jgi:rhamnosyltransferase